MLKRLLPRHYQLIQQIEFDYLSELDKSKKLSYEDRHELSRIIDDGKVDMLKLMRILSGKIVLDQPIMSSQSIAEASDDEIMKSLKAEVARREKKQDNIYVNDSKFTEMDKDYKFSLPQIIKELNNEYAKHICKNMDIPIQLWLKSPELYSDKLKELAGNREFINQF